MFQSRFLFYTCKAENNLAIIHDKAGVRENCNICNELTAMLNLISIVLFSTDVYQGSYFSFLLEHTLGNLTNTSSSPPPFLVCVKHVGRQKDFRNRPKRTNVSNLQAVVTAA